MKKLTDEQLQALLEKGYTPEDHNDQDTQLYAILFKELADPVSLPLGPTLAEDMAQWLDAEQNKKTDKQYNHAIAAIIVIALALIAIVITILPFRALEETGSVLLKHSGIILFCITAFIIIQLMDRLLIRQRIRER